VCEAVRAVIESTLSAVNRLAPFATTMRDAERCGVALDEFGAVGLRALLVQPDAAAFGYGLDS
jgi:hypothetical protein